jgi:hypothetical protein
MMLTFFTSSIVSLLSYFYTLKAHLKTMKLLILVHYLSISVLVENKHAFFHSFKLLRSFAERCNNPVIDLTKLDWKLLIF